MKFTLHRMVLSKSLYISFHKLMKIRHEANSSEMIPFAGSGSVVSFSPFSFATRWRQITVLDPFHCEKSGLVLHYQNKRFCMHLNFVIDLAGIY